MGEDRRRRLHLLVPDGAGLVLVEAPARLPVVEFELTLDESTASVARRIVADRCGVDRPVLELEFDDHGSGDEESSGGDGHLVALVVVDPVSVAAPNGLAWHDEPDTAALPARLARRAERWLSELRGEVEPHPLRARWSQPGWFDGAAAWVTHRLAAVGREPIGAVEQFRHWTISAILRTPTADGPVWVKAVFPGFRPEPAATALLDTAAPGTVAPVLAVDADDGWLMLGDVGGDVVSERPQADGDAIRRMVALQRLFVDRTDELVAVGAPERPFAQLPAEVGEVLRDRELVPWLGTAPERVDRIVEWLTDAAGRADALGLPDTLVHGDFHPENVVVRDGAAVIFDWSDAAVANPLVDAMTWATWLDDDAARGERAWDVFLDAWADVVAPDTLRSARPLLTGLTAAYHTVSYAGIVRLIEPDLRDDLGGGLREYSRALDTAVPE